jgi:tRNA(fMet)-specific endonuclease VapC
MTALSLALLDTDVLHAIVQAATIYADLHRRGELICDADILIAATAITHGLTVATNNQAHFRRIPDLLVVNWLE